MIFLVSRYVLAIFLFGFVVCFDNKYSKDGFKAAVIEYYPLLNINWEAVDVLEQNTKAYIDILKRLSVEHAELDIVVFPEATLTTTQRSVPRDKLYSYTVQVQENVNSISICNEAPKGTEQFYIKLACAAKEFNTYLVVNLIERSSCKSIKQCAPNGWDYYNTNVVFDRNGSFVSKYRKFNLFGEFTKNVTETADISIFDTDFGVKFGMFTCFDIQFAEPTITLVKKHGIKHIVYPTMWYGELPFLTALQAQHQWAYELDAVVLASGANYPTLGTGGSGIYSGRSDPYFMDVIGGKDSLAYVAHISKEEATENRIVHETEVVDKQAKFLDDFYLLRDNVKQYSSIIVQWKQTKVVDTVCSGQDSKKLCCNFDVEIDWNEKILTDKKDHYQYRLVAFSGVRTFSGLYNGGIETCGLVACSSDTIESCSARFKNYNDVSWPATFKKISIVGNFSESENNIQFPNSALSSLRPLSVRSFEWLNRSFLEEKIIERTYNLIEPQNRLMTFAIFGRDFSRDGLPKN